MLTLCLLSPVLFVHFTVSLMYSISGISISVFLFHSRGPQYRSHDPPDMEPGPEYQNHRLSFLRSSQVHHHISMSPLPLLAVETLYYLSALRIMYNAVPYLCTLFLSLSLSLSLSLCLSLSLSLSPLLLCFLSLSLFLSLSVSVGLCWRALWLRHVC